MLDKNISSAEELREQVINFGLNSSINEVAVLRREYNETYSTSDFNQLLEQSRNPHVFAEHVLIQLTAYYLNCNINIILPQSRPTDPFITIQALAISQPALYLVNVYDDNFPDHFQSVIPTDKPIDFEGILSMFNGTF